MWFYVSMRKLLETCLESLLLARTTVEMGTFNQPIPAGVLVKYAGRQTCAMNAGMKPGVRVDICKCFSSAANRQGVAVVLRQSNLVDDDQVDDDD